MASLQQNSTPSKYLATAADSTRDPRGKATASGEALSLEKQRAIPDCKSMRLQTAASSPGAPNADCDSHPDHNSIGSSAGQASDTASSLIVDARPGITAPPSTSGAYDSSSGSTPSSRPPPVQDLRDRLTEEWLWDQDFPDGIHALAIRLRDMATRSALANGSAALGDGALPGQEVSLYPDGLSSLIRK